jgi:ribosomal protein S18 acetylase RimI-like enzyme
MTTSPRSRLATEADLAYLPAIESAADELFARAGIGPMPSQTVDLAQLRDALVLLVSGDPVVGFAMVDEVDGEAHLEQLSVHPMAARQGLGTELLCAAIEWSARAGYESMTLCTFADVPWNAPFYARHGFHTVHELGPGLAKLRETERGLGLDDVGERVVMRRGLGATR